MVEKWEAKVTTKLKSTKPQQIWPLFKDFFNLHKYFPTLSASYGVHGTNGVPGCVRYCLGNSFQNPNTVDNSDYSLSVSWSKERLVEVNEAEMRLRYEIVDSNIGFESYVSTIELVSVDEGDGCVVEWGFSVEPVRGLRFEDLVKKYEVGLEKMVNAMQESLKND
ncbi:hypothetical protein vseg_002616 [Gypsophila vaccaria]